MKKKTHCPDPPFSPGLEIKSPPSSTGISRLSPAPEAAEPTFIVLPGNFSVTEVSTPDSVAARVGVLLVGGILKGEGIGRGWLLESAVLVPCLAWWELRSRSAWRARAMGSWPSYSLDMVWWWRVSGEGFWWLLNGSFSLEGGGCAGCLW